MSWWNILRDKKRWSDGGRGREGISSNRRVLSWRHNWCWMILRLKLRSDNGDVEFSLYLTHRNHNVIFANAKTKLKSTNNNKKLKSRRIHKVLWTSAFIHKSTSKVMQKDMISFEATGCKANWRVVCPVKQSETLTRVVCPVTVRNNGQGGLSSHSQKHSPGWFVQWNSQKHSPGCKHKKVQTNAYLFNTDTQYANFQGNLLIKPQNDTLQINSPGWFVQSQSKTLARVVCPVKHSPGWFVQSQSETLIRVVCPVSQKHSSGWFV